MALGSLVLVDAHAVYELALLMFGQHHIHRLGGFWTSLVLVLFIDGTFVWLTFVVVKRLRSGMSSRVTTRT